MIWYMINGFNGYEINEKGEVRSMKMMWKNPGHLLKLNNGKYTLTNNENKRVRISPQELLDIVFNSGNELKPRSEEAVYLGGRNKRLYYDKGDERYRMDFSKFIVKD